MGLKSGRHTPPVTYPDGEYKCAKCHCSLPLHNEELFPADTHFPDGNQGSLSFRTTEEAFYPIQTKNKWFPVNSMDSWGIVEKRCYMMCPSCNQRLGYRLHDGPTARYHGPWGPSNQAARIVRYRMFIKALEPANPAAPAGSETVKAA